MNEIFSCELNAILEKFFEAPEPPAAEKPADADKKDDDDSKDDFFEAVDTKAEEGHEAEAEPKDGTEPDPNLKDNAEAAQEPAAEKESTETKPAGTEEVKEPDQE